MRNDVREPRTYELMTILHPEIPEEDLDGYVERISGFVTQAGGAISETLRESPWGRRRLAYTIRHGGRDIRDGYYTLYHLDIAPDRVIEVEREMKLLPELMRYLITHYTPVPVDPRAVIDAEVDAEEAAAAAYQAAQAEATQDTDTAAEEPAASADAAPLEQAPETPSALEGEPVTAERADEAGAESESNDQATDAERHEGNGTETVTEGPDGEEPRHEGNGTETVEAGPGGEEPETASEETSPSQETVTQPGGEPTESKKTDGEG